MPANCSPGGQSFVAINLFDWKSLTMKRRKSAPNNTMTLMISGMMLMLTALFVHLRGVLQAQARLDHCQEIVQPQAVLSRSQLSQIIRISSKTSQETVQAIAKVPYCRLSQIELVTGAIAEREAYPLAFDPDTWFVLLYEGNQYVGYDFSFRH
jgi:hypothetical protein